MFLLNIQATSVRRKILIGRRPDEVVYDSPSYLYPSEIGVLLKAGVRIWGKSGQVNLWSRDSEFGGGLSSSWGLHFGFSLAISSFPIFLLSLSVYVWVRVCVREICVFSLSDTSP